MIAFTRLIFFLIILSCLRFHTIPKYLASCLDGKLIAFTENGEICWQLDSGGHLLESAKDLDQETKFVVEPIGQGSLFSSLDFKKFPKTLVEIVNSSPFLANDGSLFIGKKEAKFLLVDLIQGKVVLTLKSEQELNEFKILDINEKIERKFILIGRTEHFLSVYSKFDFNRKHFIKYSTITGTANDLTESNFIATFDSKLINDQLDLQFDSQVTALFEILDDSSNSVFNLKQLKLKSFKEESLATKIYNRRNQAKRFLMHQSIIGDTRFLLGHEQHPKMEITALTLVNPGIRSLTALENYDLLDFNDTSSLWTFEYPQPPLLDMPERNDILSLRSSVIIGFLLFIFYFLKWRKRKKLTNILNVSDQVLGYGSQGTVVFKGEYQGRKVAIKRLLLDFYHLAEHEVDLLSLSDHHPNVIRYFFKESDDKFMFLALELCICNLSDLISQTRNPETNKLLPNGQAHSAFENIKEKLTPKGILLEMMQGLSHLHKLKISHRDLKPQNILISFNYKVLISDFGLCRKEENLQMQTVSSGTLGWRAPEAIICSINEKSHSSKLKITNKIDIFSAGLIFYHVLTGGKHPFDFSEQNIINFNPNLETIFNFEAFDLIKQMIDREPENRPSADQVLEHPFFWDHNKRLNFLVEVSDRLELLDANGKLVYDRLELSRKQVFYGKWHCLFDQQVVSDLTQFRKYNGSSLRDLLRVIRNKKHHYGELDDKLKEIIGEIPVGFLNYFCSKCPKLLCYVWKIVKESPLAKETRFSSFFA